MLCLCKKKKKSPGCHRDTRGMKAETFCEILLLLNEDVRPSAATQPCRRKQAPSHQLSAHKPRAPRTQQTSTVKSSSQKCTRPLLTICITSTQHAAAACRPLTLCCIAPPLGTPRNISMCACMCANVCVRVCARVPTRACMRTHNEKERALRLRSLVQSS